jgi:hypothetical protein
VGPGPPGTEILTYYSDYIIDTFIKKFENHYFCKDDYEAHISEATYALIDDQQYQPCDCNSP